MPEDSISINIGLGPNHCIRLKLGRTNKQTDRISEAIGIKTSNESVIYVDKNKFFKKLSGIFHQISPQLDTKKCIESIKERITADKTILEMEALINSETLHHRFNRAKTDFLKKPTHKKLGALFALSSEAREYQETIDKNQKEYQNIQNEVLSIARRSSLRTHLFKAAAHKGEALRSGIDAIVAYSKKGGYVQTKNTSANTVYLAEAAIFKLSEKRAESEERQIDGLMSIVLPDAVVPQMTMGFLKPEKYGFSRASSLNWQEKERLIQFDEPTHLWNINLTEQSAEIVNLIMLMDAKYRSTLGTNVRVGVKKIAFTDLLKELDDGTRSLSTKVDGESLRYHLACFTPIGVAVAFHALGLASEKDVTFNESYKYEFVPIFSNKEEEKAYAACESKVWQYQCENEKEWSTVSFKELYKKCVEGCMNEHTLLRIKGETNLIDPDLVAKLDVALNCKLKFVPPALMGEIQDEIAPLFTLADSIIAKPFVKNMVLLENVSDSSSKFIFSHLTPLAESKLIFTLDALFMDLHANNLGLAPVVPDEYLEFATKTYSYREKKEVSLAELILDYESGYIVNVVNPPLGEFLKWKWDVILFDTDRTFGESNDIKTRLEQNLVPLRSHVLALDWKDKELSAEALNELKEMDSRIDQANAWLAHEDAPVLQKVSKDKKKEFSKLLNEELDQPQSNFGTDWAKNNKSIGDLRKQFCLNLAENDKHEIWKLFEPSVKLNNFQARYKIAAELFPRATLHQQKAYKERVARRQALLKLHDDVQKLTPSDLENIETQEFLRKKLADIPMTTHEREKYASIFEKICQSSAILTLSEKDLVGQTSDMRRSFIAMLVECTKPTYFNIAKAMYPLLADDYALELSLTKGDRSAAGWHIGHYKNPLEERVNLAKQLVPPSMGSSIAHLEKWFYSQKPHKI